MPPPAIAKIGLDPKRRKKVDSRRRSSKPRTAGNRVQKPKQGIQFRNFPLEIQHMIWSEAMQKPACHTFKILRPKPLPYGPSVPWTIDLVALPKLYDPSAYRQWKSILYNGRDLEKESIKKTKDDGSLKTKAEMSYEAYSKLANGSFQAGFRSAMVDFQRIFVKSFGFYQNAAAIDVATDLVIIEPERGVKTPASPWFEHSTPRMLIHTIRRRMRHFKRVAVHYRKSHNDASERGPFECYCPAGAQSQCYQYKACPVEQACFLDCFENLEEFYYVVEVSRKREMPWYAAYRDHARRQNYKISTSDNPQSVPFQLAHFYDTKKEFIQQCPKIFVKLLPTHLLTGDLVELFASRSDPNPRVRPEAMDKPRDCLVKVMETYKGKQGSETFINSLEQRQKVKFGILLAYNLEK